jgi:hypothetical protein
VVDDISVKNDELCKSIGLNKKIYIHWCEYEPLMKTLMELSSTKRVIVRVVVSCVAFCFLVEINHT